MFDPHLVLVCPGNGPGTHGRGWLRHGILLACLVFGWTAPPALPAQVVRLGQPTGFVAAKYATRTSAWLYAGHPIGPLLLVLGAVQNPRSGYQELAAGVGAAVSVSQVRTDVGLLLVSTSDGLFAQGYLTPTLRRGVSEASVALSFYLPIGSGEPTQLYVDPLAVYVRLGRVVRVGAHAVVKVPSSQTVQLGVGPVVELSPLGPPVAVEWLAGISDYPSEVRVGVQIGL